MTKILRSEIEKLITREFSLQELEVFTSQFRRKKETQNPTSENDRSDHQHQWESAINKFKAGGLEIAMDTYDIIDALEFDIAVSPYTGTTFEARIPFYKWCLQCILHQTKELN